MTKKLNILHWPTSYPDESRNQPYAAIFVKEHIQSTKSLVNNRVLFISPENTFNKNNWHEQTNTIEDGIPVTRFYFNRQLNVHFLNIYIRLILILYFIRLIIKDQFYPNIIHLHFFPAGEWASVYAKIFRIKTIVTEHWTALIGYPKISSKRFVSAKKVYEQASFILPVSTHLKEGILYNTKASIIHKTKVVHNCVDSQIFYSKTVPTQSEYKIISVARLEEQKDIPTMLKAFQLVKEKLSGVTLNIIGGGDSSPFMQIAKDLNIMKDVNFMGAQSKTIIAQKMRESNLFILSSISENSPCVIGEAHCCGLPVVATDVGGVKELIIEGGVVPPKSPELLAEKILEQLERKVGKATLAQKAQAQFSYDAIGQQIFEVYQTVCAE